MKEVLVIFCSVMKVFIKLILFKLIQIMSSAAKGKSLTLELVFNKTKSDNLSNIKNLNLWGNDLEDLKLIEKMPNLEVISLSVNKISSLKDFASCNKLHELYLRKNCITDLREIRYLLDLPYLKSLWLHDNPCSTHQNYREIVIHHLPNLNKLDNSVVTPEEKAAASNPKYSLDLSSQSTNIPGYLENFSKPEPVKSSQHQIKRNRPSSEVYREERNLSDQAGWKGSNREVRQPFSEQDQLNRNKNILIAVLSLMKELDTGSLQIVRKEAQKELMNR